MADNTTKEEALTGCGAFFVLLILAPFSTWLNAWVMLKMYNWFILPFVANAPALTFIPFIGISCIVGMLTIHLAKTDNTKADGTKMKITEVFGMAVSKMFLYPLIALGFAWLYQFIFIR